MRKFAFLFGLVVTLMFGFSLFKPKHQFAGGVSALPVPGLDAQQPARYETATFALG